MGLIARIVGGALGLALLAGIAWAVQDRFRLAAIVSAAKACAKASLSETAKLDTCVEEMRFQIAAARDARRCGRAIGLQDRGQAMFEIRATCLAPIKQEVAARAAAEGNLADAQATIRTLEANQAAAAQRGEARGQSLATMRSQANDAIRVAPLVGPGIVRCDARCLRALAGR